IRNCFVLGTISLIQHNTKPSTKQIMAVIRDCGMNISLTSDNEPSSAAATMNDVVGVTDPSSLACVTSSFCVGAACAISAVPSIDRRSINIQHNTIHCCMWSRHDPVHRCGVF